MCKARINEEGIRDTDLRMRWFRYRPAGRVSPGNRAPPSTPCPPGLPQPWHSPTSERRTMVGTHTLLFQPSERLVTSPRLAFYPLLHSTIIHFMLKNIHSDIPLCLYFFSLFCLFLLTPAGFFFLLARLLSPSTDILFIFF